MGTATAGFAEYFRTRQSEGRLVGFCPWLDGDGMLWGYVKEVKRNSVVFDLIDIDGSPDDTREIPFSTLLYVDEDEEYEERLKRLAGFQATKPEKRPLITSRKEVYAALEEAARSGEVLRAQFRGEESFETITCERFDGDLVHMTTYDELMRVNRRQIWRKAAVVSVRRGDRMCECDRYLLSLQQGNATTAP